MLGSNVNITVHVNPAMAGSDIHEQHMGPAEVFFRYDDKGDLVAVHLIGFSPRSAT